MSDAQILDPIHFGRPVDVGKELDARTFRDQWVWQFRTKREARAWLGFMRGAPWLRRDAEVTDAPTTERYRRHGGIKRVQGKRVHLLDTAVLVRSSKPLMQKFTWAGPGKSSRGRWLVVLRTTEV